MGGKGCLGVTYVEILPHSLWRSAFRDNGDSAIDGVSDGHLRWCLPVLLGDFNQQRFFYEAVFAVSAESSKNSSC